MENNLLPAEIATAKLVEIVQTAPAILKDSKTRHDRAVEYGNNLLDKAEEHGMSDDLDALMADYQGKLRVTYKTIYDARRPFTQIVDEVKKEFTTLESDIDPAGKSNIFFKIQGIRNIFVTDKIAIQKKKDAEVLRLQNIEKEKIEIEKQVTIAVNESFGQYLSGVKSAMNNIFEGMKLDSVESTRKMITATPMGLTKIIFDTFAKQHFFVNFLTPEQVNEIIAAKKSEDLFVDLNDVCGIDLMEYRRELIEKIPSKQKELETIANAGIEEAAKLEKEAKERQELEAQRLLDDAAKKLLEVNQNAAVEAAGKTFEATIATQAQLFQTEAPKTKDGYMIEVNHRAGYGLLFQFWFEKEGCSLPADKIEKKTIGQMKAFCEAYAIKNDEKIVSPLLKYTETYKAK